MAGLRPCAGVFQTEGEKQPAPVADLQILRFGVREGQNGGILRRSDKKIAPGGIGKILNGEFTAEMRDGTAAVPYEKISDRAPILNRRTAP